MASQPPSSGNSGSINPAASNLAAGSFLAGGINPNPFGFIASGSFDQDPLLNNGFEASGYLKGALYFSDAARSGLAIGALKVDLPTKGSAADFEEIKTQNRVDYEEILDLINQADPEIKGRVKNINLSTGILIYYPDEARVDEEKVVDIVQVLNKAELERAKAIARRIGGRTRSTAPPFSLDVGDPKGGKPLKTFYRPPSSKEGVLIPILHDLVQCKTSQKLIDFLHDRLDIEINPTLEQQKELDVLDALFTTPKLKSKFEGHEVALLLYALDIDVPTLEKELQREDLAPKELNATDYKGKFWQRKTSIEGEKTRRREAKKDYDKAIREFCLDLHGYRYGEDHCLRARHDYQQLMRKEGIAMKQIPPFIFALKNVHRMETESKTELEERLSFLFSEDTNGQKEALKQLRLHLPIHRRMFPRIEEASHRLSQHDFMRDNPEGRFQIAAELSKLTKDEIETELRAIKPNAVTRGGTPANFQAIAEELYWAYNSDLPPIERALARAQFQLADISEMTQFIGRLEKGKKAPQDRNLVEWKEKIGSFQVQWHPPKPYPPEPLSPHSIEELAFACYEALHPDFVQFKENFDLPGSPPMSNPLGITALEALSEIRENLRIGAWSKEQLEAELTRFATSNTNYVKQIAEQLYGAQYPVFNQLQEAFDLCGLESAKVHDLAKSLEKRKTPAMGLLSTAFGNALGESSYQLLELLVNRERRRERPQQVLDGFVGNRELMAMLGKDLRRDWGEAIMDEAGCTIEQKRALLGALEERHGRWGVEIIKQQLRGYIHSQDGRVIEAKASEAAKELVKVYQWSHDLKMRQILEERLNVVDLDPIVLQESILQGTPDARQDIEDAWRQKNHQSPPKPLPQDFEEIYEAIVDVARDWDRDLGEPHPIRQMIFAQNNRMTLKEEIRAIATIDRIMSDPSIERGEKTKAIVKEVFGVEEGELMLIEQLNDCDLDNPNMDDAAKLQALIDAGLQHLSIEGAVELRDQMNSTINAARNIVRHYLQGA